MKPARFFVLQALLKVEEDAGYSNIVLDQTLSSHPLSPQDRRFAAALFYGVLERLLTLDAVLAPLSQKPLSKWDAPVRMACRMGAYQIYYMDSVPDAAAVNESVKLVRMAGKSRAAGFVNGVLRNLLRQKDSAPFPPAGKNGFADKGHSLFLPGLAHRVLGKGLRRRRHRGAIGELKLPPAGVCAGQHAPHNAGSALADTARTGDGGAAGFFFAKRHCFAAHRRHRRKSRISAGAFPCAGSVKPAVLLFSRRKASRTYLRCVGAAPGGKTFTIAQAMQGTGGSGSV